MLRVCVAVLVLCVGAMAAPSVVQMKMMNIVPAQMRHPLAHVSFEPYDETWTHFKASHGKTYKDEQEENLRFNVFMNHVKLIEKHNSLYHSGDKSYFLGLNQFADMTNLEFRQYNGFGRHLLGGKADPQSPCNTTYLSPHFVALPKSVDWRDKGYVTPVKNQGQCGSCWSFSTTGSVEGQHYRKTGDLVSLSEQQLVDCSGKYGNQGCNGGLMDEAFAYILGVGGLETEDEYPYDAKDERCHFKKREVAATISGCVDVPSEDEDKLKEAVGTVGPVSVAIDASHASFQLYSGGVYDEPECSSTALDHGVLTAGYGTSDEGDDFWLVKNSWGTKWGEEGYIKMSRNKKNQCGIATQASYPLV